MSELIARQLKKLSDDFQLRPVTASEIEFYLTGADAHASMDAFWQDVREASEAKAIAIYNTVKEDGHEQFELSLRPADALKTAADTAHAQEIITHVAASHRMVADFSAKPYADQPGSGLHIHVHLMNAAGKNIFFKDNDVMSPQLQFSIGGLLAWMNPCMAVFAPMTNSYARFLSKTNAPKTVSWGANNRTTAIRLPDTEHNNKRIEHRVAGADADVAKVMAVVLAAMHYGLHNQCDPGPQIFGDATLPMYKLPPILATREEAQALLKTSPLFKDYFSVSDLLPAA